MSVATRTSLYERLGGAAAIAAAVDLFYQKVLRDKSLKGFFKHTDMAHQRQQQVDFLTTALGGPDVYQGQDMTSAHHNMGLTERHFGAVAGHLVNTLQELGVAPNLIDEVAALVSPLKEEIVTMKPSATLQRPAPSSNGNGHTTVLDRLDGLRNALDNLGTNVFVADRKGNIVFANKKAGETLAKMEETLMAEFGVKATQVEGGSIDRFHKGPAAERIRALLKDIHNLPHRAAIRVGQLWLDLNVNAIVLDDGTYGGVIVNWEEISQLKRAEDDAARLKNMMQNMPINVLLADLDFNFIYMNPASERTLKSLEHLLPDKVENLLGRSIDIFHKNPEAVRNIIKNPKNLPHDANIKLGEEVLNLLVNPTYNAKGEYIGPMVTWRVITEDLALKAREKEMQEQVRSDREALQQKVDAMLNVVNAAKSGDLTTTLEISGDDAAGQMAQGLGLFLGDLRDNLKKVGQIVHNLMQSSEELNSISNTMAGAAEETSAQSSAASAASEQVGRSTETVAAGTEEMSASIKEIARNAAEAAKVAARAVQAASATNGTIAKLGNSSNEIGKVIKTITAIAQQTNLLALNATIEAARAGEAGKGFAVVANEVKELAKQTAGATEDITQRIEDIQRDTSSAVDAIANIESIIQEIDAISNAIAISVDEQTTVTNDITRNVGEAARGVASIVQNIGAVNQAARNTAEGAASTQMSARQLLDLSKPLQSWFEGFRL